MRDNKRRGGGGGGGRNFASLVDMIEVDENFLQYLENKEDIQGESTGRDSNPEPAKKKKFQRSMSINDFFLYRRATSCGVLFSCKYRPVVQISSLTGMLWAHLSALARLFYRKIVLQNFSCDATITAKCENLIRNVGT